MNTHKPEYYRWNQWLFLQLCKRGIAYRRKAPSNWCRKLGSCIVGVAVHPSFRKRGFGTKLVQHGLEEAEARGIRTAYISTGIENTAMQRLAEKLEFARYAVLEKDGWRFTRYKRRI